MLEIVFSDGKIGAKAVKIIGLAENSKLNSAFYQKMNRLWQKGHHAGELHRQKNSFVEVSVPAAKLSLPVWEKSRMPLRCRRWAALWPENCLRTVWPVFMLRTSKGANFRMKK